MQFKVQGEKDNKGFLLERPVVFDGNIIVLTGKNGSGKTRFIESIKNQCSTAFIDDEIINPQDVRVVPQASLNPNFGPNYNDAQYQQKITASLQLFDRIKDDLKHELDRKKIQDHSRMREGGLDYESLFKLCQSIAKVVEKPAYELTHDDIIFHFEEPARNILGIQNISTIVNQYIKRLHKNEFNEWKCTQKGSDVQYWSDEEFLDKFGDKPWVLINRILDDTFDGKFEFSSPDESSQSYTYQAQLLQRESKATVSVEHLSSGEKTLLWLALTLFNSQYYDDEIANAPRILLIDEPDAFLHPKMVLKMYKALDSFKNNFNSIVIISTHSPTTVALAPNDSVYLIDNNCVDKIEKDSAISDLLDGVSQISLNPQNRRQIFVESQYDVDVYQSLYSKLMHRSELIDPKISLSFVSSGPKMPKQQLIDKAKQILGVKEEVALNEFIESINGVGNCVQVIGQVEALAENDNNTVRGIIDWDLKNKPTENVAVFASEYSYSIENVTLDPICMLLLLHIEKPESMTISDICGENVHWSDWLKDKTLLQESVDRFIFKVLGRDNNKDQNLSYVSGMDLKTDSEYLKMNGHDLERHLKKVYAGLNAFCKKGKDGELKCSIVNRSMINLTNGDFIPSVYENVIADVQK
ncbi:ATP-binding protein [Shewanella algae]|uniref:ATP-binding protein n=1 Tax=Shewanella algae TaxID=38313 RepID=UPI00118396F3|nr:ATP-binding protein [Shewanella algae]EKT4489581.1 ATP-binding protein [Shewanella algae]MBO2549016.1 ATP-binding protein [Shewanella algae]TVL08210.1 hypothetical protein AYI82_12010 [Shewanella algae]HDS1200698.1 ATP-binding protein [Shewanella algae]